MSINGISKKPTLRFTDYNDEWDYVRGDELFAPISNKEHNSDLPILALTQDQGAVPRDLINYNVIVSDKSVAGYKVVEIDDFIISLRSFQGGIEYSRYKGLCSPAYIVLRKKDNNLSSDFYRIYFKSFNYIQELNKKLEGIRDGKMVSYGQFSEILLPKPSFSEQQKIADCISALEDLISSQDQKVDALKAHKKGLMQQLFPQSGETTPRLRFPGFTGEWEEKKLTELAQKMNRRNRQFEVTRVLTNSANDGVVDQNEYFDRDIAVKSNTDNYHIVELNDFVYNPRISTSAPVGPISINKIGKGIMSPLYTVFKFHKGYVPFFEFYFQTNIWHPYLKGIANFGARFDRMNITSEGFFNMPLYVPSLIEEQQKIASCLSALDDTIVAETDKLEALKAHKKGLMQQLFPNF